ncbi:hypothetical protein [Streptantibioticus cattleyicolor]|uniref:Uncharacterized protein n=1 Tax=Streptantibioticus cattleyicolor (strain ATCC 35852 / DSM 46488 / JCM 4925 / NBRC 14057 / NRRL 8057) TaxID=1003195 RepID=F8JLM0_STREN|nr:hypothetical protein [Streptantibioticus cattleyicolor]AEW98248.1 hypothetical protein SCATT_p00550 [Streptantibioticus cattleyicolor NRRL 8057 = DSM 46488]CCB72688.1 conserved exported protein of unknown function [Streptantibioticus cattleyicolor NRRL 8057 = DSM 46488]
MSRTARAAAAAVLGLGMAVLPSAAHAATATASPDGVINHSCGLNANPHQDFLSPPVTEHSVRVGSAVVELRAGTTPAQVLERARIRQAAVGDTVWLDWSDNGRRDWHVCGPNRVASGHDALTRANNPVSGRSMRACGHHAGVTRCTVWD